MNVEIIIAIVIVAAAAVVLAGNYKKKAKSTDASTTDTPDQLETTKINEVLDDAKEFLDSTAASVKQIADVNKDGQVNVEDIKAGAAEIAETVKKTAARVRKPRAKKSST